MTQNKAVEKAMERLYEKVVRKVNLILGINNKMTFFAGDDVYKIMEECAEEAEKQGYEKGQRDFVKKIDIDKRVIYQEGAEQKAKEIFKSLCSKCPTKTYKCSKAQVCCIVKDVMKEQKHLKGDEK